MPVPKASRAFRESEAISAPREIPAVKALKEMQAPWGPREVPGLWDLPDHRETLAPRDQGVFPGLLDLPVLPDQWVLRA